MSMAELMYEFGLKASMGLALVGFIGCRFVSRQWAFVGSSGLRVEGLGLLGPSLSRALVSIVVGICRRYCTIVGVSKPSRLPQPGYKPPTL